MQHIFVSYAHKDAKYMARIANHLRTHNLEIWIDDEGLKVGTPSWRKAIEGAIEASDCVLVIMSKYAKASEWVDNELQYAHLHGKRVFAVLMRGKETEAIALNVAGSQWIDVRHQKFEKGMEKLVKDIYAYLEEIGSIQQPIARQSRQDLLQNAEKASESDPNYKYRFFTDNEVSGIEIAPKHEKSVENHPMGADFTVDQTSAEKIEKSFETGESVTVDVLKFVPKGLPDWLEQGEITEARLTILPIVPDESLPLQILFFDSDKQPLLTTPYVQLKLARRGTKVEVWRGKSPTQPIEYILTVNKSDKTISFNFSFNFEDRNPIAMQGYLNTIDKLNQTTSIHFMNLVNQEGGTLNRIINKEIHHITELERRFIEALVTIYVDLGVNIPVPVESEHPEAVIQPSIYNALETAKILRTGTYPHLPGLPDNVVIMVSASSEFVSQVLDAFEQEGKVNWKYDNPDNLIEMSADILGQTIKLGKAYYVFPNSKILNVEEVRDQLTQAESDADRIINVVFDIDREQSYIQFLDWPKNNDHDPESQPEVVPQ